IPILRALQHLYADDKLRRELLGLVGKDVNEGTDCKFGRRGMNYWEIIVLAAARLGCNLDYDKLQDLAENHRTLRQIMGIGWLGSGQALAQEGPRAGVEDWPGFGSQECADGAAATVLQETVEAGHAHRGANAPVTERVEFCAGPGSVYPGEVDEWRDGGGDE